MVRRESDRSIAYFTMEIGLRNDIPTFSGGLGVLAGDTIKSASDLGLPVVVVTLLSRQGYFRQEIDAAGRQHEHPVSWNPAAHMKLQGPRVRVQIEGRLVQIQAWRYDVESLGVPGVVVPVYFLDTDVEGNDPRDREHHRRALRRRRPPPPQAGGDPRRRRGAHARGARVLPACASTT